MVEFMAVLLGTAGVAALYASWRRWIRFGPWPAVAGWTLLGASVWVWVRAAGIEFGISYAVLFASFAAWIAVLVNLEIRNRRQREQKTSPPVVPDAQSLARHVGRFLVAVPLAAVAAAFVGAAIVRWLPMARVDAMAAAAFSIPVLWGILGYWACADPKLTRAAVSLAVAGIVSATVVFGV